MTYQEFKEKYNGKYIDYDKAFGNQCWDLAEQYAVECLGIPEYVLAGCGNVRNLLKEPKINDMREYFDEVDEYHLNAGDIIIFEYGHICIFDHWDGQHCWYFSQNPNPCQVMQINRGGVHGFRLKQHNNENIDNNTDNTNNEPTNTEENKEPVEEPIQLGDIVIVNGSGNGSSDGTNASWTKKYENTTMKVILINENSKYPYACNQYSEGTVGNAEDVTAWFSAESVKKK